MEHLGVLKNSLKHVHAFQIKLEIGSVFKERRKPENSEKTSQSKGENQREIQRTNGLNTRIQAKAISMGDECCHHCPTLAPLIKNKL